MECPYCNGSGHHSYKDCIKCNGTGEYELPEQKKVENKSLGISRLLLAWVGFFLVTFLVVLGVIFLDETGIKNQVVSLILSIASWIIIFFSINVIVENRKRPKSERKTFTDPSMGVVENVFGVSFLIGIAAVFIVLAVYPLTWIL